LYNKTVFQALEKAVGQGEAVLFARSATAGCQKFPVHWGGDSQSTFESMAESLRGGLSLGLSGFGFWSHDIGGFDGSPPADVYKRWLAFGLLSSHSRLHGSASYRVPWLFDQEAVDVLRLFTKLKCRLMPYLYAQAGVATRQGTPLLRAMMLEFPDDPACDPLDRQYMLGDSLLVAPVFSSNGIVTYYLPEGNWTNFLTGKTVQGPSWVSEQHAFTSLPLMVRPNSVIPIGSREDRPDYDYGDGVTLQMYALKEGARIRTIVPTSIGSMGAKFDVKRTGQTISVEPQGDCENWHISLIGIHSITSAQNGTAEADTHGIRVTPVDGAAHVSITL
jgi:alpha-D-xyloside xylohydrolase